MFSAKIDEIAYYRSHFRNKVAQEVGVKLPFHGDEWGDHYRAEDLVSRYPFAKSVYYDQQINDICRAFKIL